MIAFTVPFTHFDVPLEVVTIGLINGLAYGLVAIGITFAYRISRVINFAQGQISALCTLVVPVLVYRAHWTFWPALAVSLGVALTVGALIDLAVMRRLVNASRLVAMAATIAIGQVLFIAGTFLPQRGLASQQYPQPFEASVHLGSLTLHTQQLVTLATVPIVVAALTYVVQRTYLGLAMRFTSENIEAAQLSGVHAGRVSTVAWMLVALFAAVGGILASFGGRAASAVPGGADVVGPTLLAIGLGASMLGGLVNLPAVFAGGVAIGVAQGLIAWNFHIQGLFELFILAVVLLSTLLRRGLGQLARGSSESSWSLTGFLPPLAPALARHPRVRAARLLLSAAVAAFALWVPLGVSVAKEALLASVLIYAIIGLSSVVLTGLAGQISLGQSAFYGFAALVAGRLYYEGFPMWMSALVAVGGGAVVALVIGVPALRVRGVFLAVVTLAFGVMAATYLPNATWLVKAAGARGSGSSVILRSKLWGIDLQNGRHYYWLCLALLVLCAAMVHRMKQTGIGRAMMAVRDNESAAAALSIDPRVTKLTAFALSGALAALAGILYAGLIVNFSFGASLFDPGTSLTVLLMVILGGVTTVSGAVLGAIWIIGVPYFLGAKGGLLASGMVVLLILLFRPAGLVSLVYAARDRLARRLAGAGTTEEPTDEGTIDLTIQPVKAPRHARANVLDDDRPLEVEHVVKRFGGLVAVADASLHARRGEIVGLVGPNGAGKTTLFEIISGAVRPDAGVVRFEGVDVSELRPEQRARLGLGRTFQQARLFPDLTLADAVKVALERGEPSELFPSLTGAPPSRAAERRKDRRAAEVLDQLGLSEWAPRPVSDLSTGLRRLAEIACAFAMGSSVMLLDEPTAGLAQREVEAFVPMLREVRASLDATMIVISHDVPMMVDLVDRLYVLDSGQVIATGDPHLLQSDPRVLAAYMGVTAAPPSRPPARRRRPLTAAGTRQ